MSSKIDKIESSLTKENTRELKGKASKKSKNENIKKQVANQFNTEMSSSSTVKGMAIKKDKKTGKEKAPANPNRVERAKPGRRKGQKPYDRIRDADGNVTAYINQHGAIILADERKQLIRAVDSLYRKRKELANREEGMLFGYNKDGELIKEQDPIMTFRASKSIDQFETREDLYNYINEIREFTSRGYVKRVADDMKDRYLKTIRNTTDMTDEEFNIIKRRIEKMSVKEFSVRFGFDIFGTITEYYERSNKTSSERRQYIQNQRTKEMTPKQIEEYLQKQEEWQSSTGGSASNVEDIMRRLGIGDDGINVDEEMKKFKDYREKKKQKKERERQRIEKKKQEIEVKYQEFLKDFNLVDSPEIRAKFNNVIN